MPISYYCTYAWQYTIHIVVGTCPPKSTSASCMSPMSRRRKWSARRSALKNMPLLTWYATLIEEIIVYTGTANSINPTSNWYTSESHISCIFLFPFLNWILSQKIVKEGFHLYLQLCRGSEHEEDGTSAEYWREVRPSIVSCCQQFLPSVVFQFLGHGKSVS